MSDLSSTPTGVTANKKKPLAKPVFASPSQIEEESASSVTADALVSRHAFNEDLDKAKEAIKREEHDKRIKTLRKELDYLAKTNWQFESEEQN